MGGKVKAQVLVHSRFCVHCSWEAGIVTVRYYTALSIHCSLGALSDSCSTTLLRAYGPLCEYFLASALFPEGVVAFKAKGLKLLDAQACVRKQQSNGLRRALPWICVCSVSRRHLFLTLFNTNSTYSAIIRTGIEEA